jgi:hypothetical protein
VGVDIETFVAEEADEGLSGLFGELDGEAGGGGDGGDDGDASCERLLHDFERRSAADQQDVVVEGHATEKRVAEDLVDGVVTADVFVEDEELACRVKQGGGVEAAGAGEGGLGLVEGRGE